MASRVLLGSDGHGVRVEQGQGVTFIFGRSAAGRYRQIAGRDVLTECDAISRSPRSSLLLDTSGGGSQLRAPVRRAPIKTGVFDRSDVCTLALPLSNNRERVIATVPLTLRGYYYLDQRSVARDIVTLAFFPSSSLSRYQRRLLNALDGVTLPSEGATPPPGKLGLYSSAGHLYVAKRDRAGVLLFFGQDGEVTRTNMLGLLLDPTALGPNPQGIQLRSE